MILQPFHQISGCPSWYRICDGWITLFGVRLQQLGCLADADGSIQKNKLQSMAAEIADLKMDLAKRDAELLLLQRTDGDSQDSGMRMAATLALFWKKCRCIS